MIAFFTSGIANEAQKPVTRAGYKEGYLTKRGKNFGGWKTRYFVLQGPSLEYYESVSLLSPGAIGLSPSSMHVIPMDQPCGYLVFRADFYP